MTLQIGSEPGFYLDDNYYYGDYCNVEEANYVTVDDYNGNPTVEEEEVVMMTTAPSEPPPSKPVPVVVENLVPGLSSSSASMKKNKKKKRKKKKKNKVAAASSSSPSVSCRGPVQLARVRVSSSVSLSLHKHITYKNTHTHYTHNNNWEKILPFFFYRSYFPPFDCLYLFSALQGLARDLLFLLLLL